MSSLSCFAPHVQQHLEVILKRGRVGLTPGVVKISNWMPSCPPYFKDAKCDRFKITVPYAGQSITWDVIFYAKHPEAAPDFIFTDETFPVELESVYNLCYWKAEDSSGLLTVIRQVLDAYRKQQVHQLSKHSRVHFEYSALLQQEGFAEQDIEIFVSPKARGPVSFLIRLPVDFSKLPPMLTPHNPDEDLALLLVTFQSPEGIRVTPQLFLSPKVEHLLGGAQQWRIPAFPSDGCLIDYVPSIVELLEKKVEQISDSFKRRKEYVSAFLDRFYNNILEYDAESFTTMSLLFEYDDFYFILSISLPLAFPTNKPSFTFQSIYHRTSGRPVSACVDYPYSPRWSPEEMMTRAETFISEYAPIFQSASVKK